MDDEGKNFRKGKPQQKLYRPGSGPLRKSSPGLDGMMENCNIDNSPRGRGQGRYKYRNNFQDDHSLGASSNKDQQSNLMRNKKPEQSFYIPRSSGVNTDVTTFRCDSSAQVYDRNISDTQGYNNGSNNNSCGRSSLMRRDNAESKNDGGNDFHCNRNHRQVSEPRSMSPSYSNQDLHFSDRNRDSRSMETSAVKHSVPGGSGGKPPSGRRNSSGYSSDVPRPKHINIDNLPPRLRKKFLAESGHHSLTNCSDYSNREQCSDNYTPQSLYSQNSVHSSPMWSQTLPSRGRGRLRDFDRVDKEKLISAYLKSYESGNSRHSTPSSSNINIYESSSNDNRNYSSQTSSNWTNDYQKEVYCSGTTSRSNETHNSLENSNYLKSQHTSCEVNDKSDCDKVPLSYEKDDKTQKDSNNDDLDHEDNEAVSNNVTNLSDMTNLDWTEEVEKNIKLEDMCDSTFSMTSHSKSSLPKDLKADEPNESKRSGKSRKREKRRRSGSKKRSQRSSSRSNKNAEKPSESMPNNQSKIEHVRKDSGLQEHPNSSSLRQKERERRDSHRSNRSSTIGNSRDDLDRWRSWRSYSREHSTERRVVSQSNSRDPSTNRAMSPRDGDGFRVPSSQASNLRSSTMQRRNSGAWSSGRMSSVERGRVSPALSNAPGSGVSGGGVTGTGGGGGGGSGEGGRHSRRRSSRRNRRDAENTAPASLSSSTTTNWREEILESKKYQRSQETKKALSEKPLPNGPSVQVSHPGLIILPQSTSTQMNSDQGRMTSNVQKTLYDHQNPSKPIIVQATPARHDTTSDRFTTFESSGRSGGGGGGHEAQDTERATRHRSLLQEVDRADAVLQARTLGGPLALASHWQDLIDTRKFLQNALQRLLMSDLWFCQSDNVEHHFWKILYYNFIENLRKNLMQVPAEDKSKVVNLINTIIEEGNIYFEELVHMLEKTYKFNVDDYLNDNSFLTSKDKYVRLALISVQKLYIFLGDLARYKEQVNETNNYAKSKLYYTKAQQINPKNGRPYNQLAILAIYARRKLDAVYYYMRSLMSSNPFQSARESLISLFDENRKKYEAAEKKRRAAREAASGAAAASGAGAAPPGRGLRREVWVRPSGGRTTTLRQNTVEDNFADMSPVELNKSFITSYLHVHGKLITRIGMETFHESAALMLRQFRALLHQQPFPMPSVRLLQLTALNMFAVETIVGSRKDGVPEMSEGANARSAWLECALAVSLLMFGALLERCCTLLPEPMDTQQHTDALLLLPAIKVWSDWMLCHRSIWNPPPLLNNYELGTENDPWDSLAKFMNILEALDDKSIVLEYEPKEGYSCVRLAEDSLLAGFTPLMYMDPATAWCSSDAPVSPHVFEHALRTRKLLFFGTEYLVGVEPPVIKLEYPAGEPPRYVSAVQRAAPTHHTPEDEPLQDVSEDSEGEECASTGVAALAGGAGDAAEGADGADEATRRLLRRKEQLEARRATMEGRRQRMQEILRGGWVSVELEVRPRWLVPDTNCFIDHLPLLQRVAAAPGQPYLLAVPLVVVTELEGLRRCGRVGGAAEAALEWLCGGAGAGVRFATSRGTLLANRTFTAERAEPRATNDDRVLATALNLHANLASEPDERGGSMGEGTAGGGSISGATGADAGGGCVRRVREVVLLTDDRNLRVKALASELPARDLPAFLQWAALPAPGSHATPNT